MKALYFAKIDYMRARTQLYMLLVITVVVIVIMQVGTNVTGLAGFMYGVFLAIIFSTAPFGNCTRKDAGFQQLLPATTLQRVLGRFLFGLSLLFVGTGIGLITTTVYCLMTGKQEMVPLPVCLITFAVALVVITVQYIFFYLVGESKGAQFLSLVRMIPGMCFFFISIKVMGAVQQDPATAVKIIEKIGGNLDSIGWGSVALAALVMTAGILLCTRATAKKDY